MGGSGATATASCAGARLAATVRSWAEPAWATAVSRGRTGRLDAGAGTDGATDGATDGDTAGKIGSSGSGPRSVAPDAGGSGCVDCCGSFAGGLASLPIGPAATEGVDASALRPNRSNRPANIGTLPVTPTLLAGVAVAVGMAAAVTGSSIGIACGTAYSSLRLTSQKQTPGQLHWRQCRWNRVASGTKCRARTAYPAATAANQSPPSPLEGGGWGRAKSLPSTPSL